MYKTDAPQVVSLNAAGDKSSARWLGQLGNVAALNYSYTFSGGASAMSCTLSRHATYRHAAMDPGRQVRIIAGGSIIWDGALDEPQPSDSGWNITGHGAGTFGDDYMAVYNTWNNNPDESINNAIGRGLRWQSDGIGSPAGMWLGQRVDPGSQSVSDLLNLVCARGGLAWYVNSRQGRNHVAVTPLPADPTRLLIANTPVARSTGGSLNRIWIRYPAMVPDGGNTVIHKLKHGFKTTSVTNDFSIAKHGPLETFLDLSSAGKPLRGLGGAPVMSQAEAQAVGDRILDRYKRISFAGPFTVHPGQLTNLGGTPVDLAMQQANGMVCKLLLTDFAMGGEVSPLPPSVIVGSYEFDVDSMTATVTPMQVIRESFASLIAEVTGEPGHGVGDWQRR